MRFGLGALQPAKRLAHDAAAIVLIAEAGRQGAYATITGNGRCFQQLADNRVLDVLHDLGKRLALEVMRINIDDRKICVAALARLLGGMRERNTGVELVDAHAPVIAERQFHQDLPRGGRARRLRYSAMMKTSP